MLQSVLDRVFATSPGAKQVAGRTEDPSVSESNMNVRDGEVNSK